MQGTMKVRCWPSLLERLLHRVQMARKHLSPRGCLRDGGMMVVSGVAEANPQLRDNERSSANTWGHAPKDYQHRRPSSPESLESQDAER